jgi:hypothetical protein
MSSIIVAMIVWNVHRLKKYLDRDLREYNCDYVEGHPYWSSQTNGGKLSIEIHKRSKMVKNNKEKKEDRLVFVAPNPGKRPIPAKMVLKGRIVAGTNKGLEEEQDEDDYVTIELPWYENGNIVRPMFKVRQETVKEVLAGISELIREDKKPEETKNLEYL